MGFLKALFMDDQVISKDVFRVRMLEPECSWILNEDEIRVRYRNTFSIDDILEEIEQNIR